MTWTTKPGGLSGGGYTNCVAFDPLVQGHIITGGDSFGLNETWDGGDHWQIANLGLTTSVNDTGSGTMPLVTGLMSRTAKVANLPAYNLEVYWKDLQASSGAVISAAGGPGTGKDAITAAIADGTPFRLRVMAGQNAPTWLKTAAGTVIIVDTNDGTQATVPKWWTTAYTNAYDDLMSKLSVLYNGVIGAIHEVGRMNVYAEPTSLHTTSSGSTPITNSVTGVVKTGAQWAAANVAALLAAGYVFGSDVTANTDLWSLVQFRTTMATHWTLTRTVFAFLPLDYIDGTGTAQQSEPLARAQMDAWGTALGTTRLILQNDSIRDSMITNTAARPYTPNTAVLQDMAAKYAQGFPVSFQTATASRVGDLNLTVLFAIDMGGHAVELPNGWEGISTPAQFTDWTAELPAVSSTGVAGIVFDPVSGKAYAGMSQSGFSSIRIGVAETDGGTKFTRWTPATVDPGGFWGSGDFPGLPAGDKRPRLTGRVLAVDNNAGTRYLYAGPQGNGLWRSTDDYATSGNSVQICSQTQLGLLGQASLECILLDPTNKTRMFVGSWAYGGAWSALHGCVLVSNIRAAGAAAATRTTLANAPPTVLDMCSVGNNVYAACGWYGVYRVTGANWDVWTPINTGLPTSNPGLAGQWYAAGIDGYNDGANDVLFLCSCNPQLVTSSRYNNVFRCTGAQGATPVWVDVTSGASNISNAVWGSGETWFPLTFFSSFALGKSSGNMDNIAIDPFTPANVHVTGQSGGWGSRNALNSAATVQWRPEVNGSGGLTTTMFITDPYQSNHAYIADTDYGIIGSSNDFVPGSNIAILPSGAGTKGIALDIGPDQALYYGGADRDTNSHGEVWRYGGGGADPLMATPVNTGFGAAAGAAQPCGIAVTGTAAIPITIVAVSNWNDGVHALHGGIWRKVGNGGAWTQVLTSPPFDSVPTKVARFPIAKDADGAAIYILDPHQGVFRSKNQGLTWVLWWAITDGVSLGSDSVTVGCLYVCRKSGIYRIDNANTV